MKEVKFSHRTAKKATEPFESAALETRSGYVRYRLWVGLRYDYDYKYNVLTSHPAILLGHYSNI